LRPVVVVGAGVVGASIAYHLARSGMPVTLIERASVPAAGVTGTSFGWIGGAGGDWPGGAQDLRASVIADHRRLENEIPGVAVQWTGSLDWTGQRAGQWIEPDQIHSLEPNLRTVPARAVYSPTDGGVDPVGMTNAMVRAARRLGAHVVLRSAVTTVHPRGVSSSTGYHEASTVVLATGADVPALTGSVGMALSVAASPALLVRVAAPADLIRTIVATPDFEARQVRPGELVMTVPVADPGGVEQAVDRLRATFRNSGSVRLLGWAIGERPMPPGGPLVGYLPPGHFVYVAVTHSGVTLAPTLGRLIAQELTTGQPAPELRRCRPVLSAGG
jgi:glycine/D-amino acid oxidase-like deaminating enzyme